MSGEYVFYCPECDGLHVYTLDEAFIFENDLGKFIKVWERPQTGDLGVSMKMHDLYLVGSL